METRLLVPVFPFLLFSPIFFHFLAIQTRLDDDKSRHTGLKPLHPSRGGPLGEGCEVNCIFSCFIFIPAFMGVYVPASYLRLKSSRPTLIDVYLASFLVTVDAFL